MSIVRLKSDYERLLADHEAFLKDTQESYTDEAKKAFLRSMKSTSFKLEDLIKQWDDQLARAQESVNRKWSRMNMARTAYLLENQFQAEHAHVNTIITLEGVEVELCGYYKVYIINSREGPTHYEFFLERGLKALADEIPYKVIVPLSTMMGVGVWSDVTPKKINFIEDQFVWSLHDDDVPCHFCRRRLDDCPEDGDHSEEIRYLERQRHRM